MFFDWFAFLATLLNLVILISIAYGIVFAIRYFKNLSKGLKRIEEKLENNKE